MLTILSRCSHHTKGRSDSGLCLNYHAVSASKYKYSFVCGFVHRVFRSCSAWTHFDDCLNKLKNILEGNQYPPGVYNPIIRKAINNLLMDKSKNEKPGVTKTRKTDKLFCRLQYRGGVTD